MNTSIRLKYKNKLLNKQKKNEEKEKVNHILSNINILYYRIKTILIRLIHLKIIII